MPHTPTHPDQPDLPDLPGAAREAATLQHLWPTQVTVLGLPTPTPPPTTPSPHSCPPTTGHTSPVTATATSQTRRPATGIGALTPRR